MIWILLLAVPAFFIIRFILSSDNDKRELESKKLNEKFNILLEFLNNNFFSGKGIITILDDRSLNLYQVGENKILQLFYSTGTLNITCRTKEFGKEIVCSRDFHNLRNITDEKQIIMGAEYTKYVNDKIKAYELLTKNSTLSRKSDLEDITVFSFNKMFYQFCFDTETAKIFLEANPMRENIIRGLALSDLADETILKTIFKTYIRKCFKVNLEEQKPNHYKIGDSTLLLLGIRYYIEDNENSYFEILYHDLEKVKDVEGNEVSIAEQFHIYVQNGKPTAIFVIIFDALLETYVIRRVFENGNSEVVSFIKDNDENQTLHYLISFVEDNF